MNPLQSLYSEAIFLLSTLSWLGLFDLLLVAITFYLLLRLVQHSRAAFLLRGVLVLSLALFIVSVLLPLPAFEWLVRMALLGILILTPIIFQPELRRLLERLGRSTGLARAVRQTATEQATTQLIRAVENMSETQTGALIAIEGNQTLQPIAETGVAINGRVSSELIQAIFYSENPLHDGAVIIREDKVVAASCLLPLTQRLFNFRRRLGTRHRAAVGLSEASDALVIVVSEETGAISVARHGRLQYQVDKAILREQLFEIYVPSLPPVRPLSLTRLLRQAGHLVWSRPAPPDFRQTVSNVVLIITALLLALVVWSFVVQRTNPTRRALVEAINLRIDGLPPNSALVTPAPAIVSASIQTTDQLLATLSPSSFRAFVSLEGLSPGLHHLPIRVTTGASPVRIISVEPATVDLEIAPIISQTVPVTVELPDLHRLPPSYQLASPPSASPAEVEVSGPAPLVEQVSQAQASLAVADATSSLREIRPLQPLNEAGNPVSGVRLHPNRAQVMVPIRRRQDTHEVGVRAVITATPPAGYWLSGLEVRPASVTVKGNQEQMAEIGSFVNTIPVDVSQAVGDLRVEVPLDLPAGVEILDRNGELIHHVTVLAQIDARQGDLALTQSVELIGVPPGITATVTPLEVDLLLSGPLPTLNQIEMYPDLVRVTVNVNDLALDQETEITPTVFGPEAIQTRIVPPSVLVRLSQ
jgi:diadenylate cyclase